MLNLSKIFLNAVAAFMIFGNLAVSRAVYAYDSAGYAGAVSIEGDSLIPSVPWLLGLAGIIVLGGAALFARKRAEEKSGYTIIEEEA